MNTTTSPTATKLNLAFIKARIAVLKGSRFVRRTLSYQNAVKAVRAVYGLFAIAALFWLLCFCVSLVYMTSPILGWVLAIGGAFVIAPITIDLADFAFGY